MLKIHQIYLRKFFFLFFALFLIIGGVVYFWIKDFYINQTKTSLQHNLELISISLCTHQNLDQLAQETKEKLKIRLTIIDNEGKVIAESHEDKSKMENHKYRDEIMQTQKSEYGYIIRHSATIDQDLLYVAKRYTIDDKVYYIRMARGLEKISSQIQNLGIEVAAYILLFFLAVMYVGYTISKGLQSETNKIMQFLYDLTKKKKSSYITSEYSQEFYMITKHLTKVSKILTKQNKQKDKYTTKLKNANSQKDDIISAISHEFKNPIAVISGYVQTLRHDDDIPEALRNKFLAKIEYSAVKMTNIIDRLRLSLKLEQSTEKLTLKQTNLYNLVNQLKNDLLDKYTNRKIELSGDQDFIIEIDETLFGIAITNLIENALKYSEDKVAVKVHKDCIIIEDYGIGIEEKELAKIMKKFYRVSNNKWNNSLGLGLHIVKNIIDLHKFKINIQSIYHEGTTFTILFKR